MARWGNALGAWRKQRRNSRGQFSGSGKAQAKAIYKARKKGNAKAHRSRVKGSVKARGKEFVTTAPRRSRQMAAGAAIYSVGRYSGSARAQQVGFEMARKGVSGAKGRTTATYHMSKCLKRSRNRQAKDQYYRQIGTTRAKRNAMKAATVVGIAGAAAVAHRSDRIDTSYVDRGVSSAKKSAAKRGFVI